ncbi:hypothetical protein PYW08_016559 [Mythimna loreyi]|uniref:Uncharacterized protein n=1 Tax=Mythimna loreyi TaxID=667449 RepID=A0ACC2QXC0_9NEOP|nr:hypothetical protein PYW08_016559 [Mythimna loreyi]
MRCFARMDAEKLRQDASKLDWGQLAAAQSVDDKLDIFNRTVLALYDRHAPVKKVKLKRQPAPWMTADVRMAMRRRDRAFRKFKKNRSVGNRDGFKAARNRCNQVIRNAKRRHILENISSSSPADIWKFLGTLGIGRPRHVEFPKTIVLDDINRHFTASCHLDSQMLSRTVDFISGLPGPAIEPFHFSPATLDEIKKIILSIKSKAVGHDDISRHMITLILDFLLPPITHIINFSLDSGQFPSLWRMAYVRPLPKIANPSLSNHFRPISILPFLSKVLEACVHKQFSGFVHRNNLVDTFQSGFRPGHSTASALLKVTGDIRDAMEDTKVTVLVLIDFSNAFNAVSHDILLSILSHLMVSSEALEWFSSYLRGRRQSVRVGENSSSWRDLDSGVPQGGILSPLLFSIFINFITHCLRCSYHLYADDLQLYTAARVEVLSDAIEDVNRDLEAICDWSKRFGVSVNPSKCQAIIIGSSRMMGKVMVNSLPPIIFNGIVIPISPSVKDLGLHLDSTLGWQSQVSSVCQRVNGTLRCLYRLRNFLPAKTKTMLVQTLIFPVIDYGDVCYFDLNAVLLDKLDRLLNNCIRFIYNLRKYDHVSSYRTELKWMPIRQRRNLRALTTLFSLLNSPTPPSYLISHFQYLSSSHAKNLRSSKNLLLICPSHTSNFVHSSFYIQSILLWNALPLDIRMATSRYSFKLMLRKYFLHK